MNGSYPQLELCKETKKHIIRMLNGSTNRCFLCSSDTHFVNQCELYKERFTETSSDENSDNSSEKSKKTTILEC